MLLWEWGGDVRIVQAEEEGDDDVEAVRRYHHWEGNQPRWE